jgi:hypothetical protein
MQSRVGDISEVRRGVSAVARRQPLAFEYRHALARLSQEVRGDDTGHASTDHEHIDGQSAGEGTKARRFRGVEPIRAGFHVFYFSDDGKNSAV